MASLPDSDCESEVSFRYTLEFSIGDCEDLENYEPGGFHPVHLGDTYDNERYRVIHKLGFGGFSTVWLARDEVLREWVALKIVSARHSSMVEVKSARTRQAVSSITSQEEPEIVVDQRHFTFEGPNGRHLCQILPVLGPSASRLSEGIWSRTSPWLSRKASYLATQCLANLHSRGLCHGDLTTANILFKLRDFDGLSESDIYRIFGEPEKSPVTTLDGEPVVEPPAPLYVVRTLDFLAAEKNFISSNAVLIDYDQSFPIDSPPTKILGTPAEWLAPEVAVGLAPSPASDVWALGCSIFRLRSGEGPFAKFEVNSPGDLLRCVMQTLGDPPNNWEKTLFNTNGKPTKDPAKGRVVEKWEGERSIKDMVYKTWDRPTTGVIATGHIREPQPERRSDRNEQYPVCFSDMVWKPSAIEIDGDFIYGYSDETDSYLAEFPKISTKEADLLYDLLMKIFIYDPKKRMTAIEMLNHPWFLMEDPQQS